MTSSPPPDEPAGYPDQPQYAAAPQYGLPPAPPRPGMVTAGGVVMIVMGALAVLFGLLMLLGGVFIGGAGSEFESEIPGLTGMSGAVAGVIIVIALVILAFGILDILAGAYVIGGRGWARITGIVLAAIMGLLALTGLTSEDPSGIIITIVLVAANAFIIWALASTGSWFAARSVR